MRKAHMIVHQVREPALLNIRLLTEFIDLDTRSPNSNQRIATFIIYTRSAVFEGELRKIDVNSQLAWNEQCISALTDALSGKRQNIEIKFREEEESSRPTEMSLICEIETGINVRIFQINMFRIPEAVPMVHMRGLFMEYKEVYGEQEKRLKQERERVQHEMKEMAALEKQIEEQTVTEIAHLKKNFIDVINDCKKQLRKHMKTGISDIVNEEEEAEEEHTRRKFVRVNREALEEPQQPKNYEKIVENQYMDMLFDP